MHWLEIIRLLASQAKADRVVEHLHEVAAALERTEGQEAVTVYSRQFMEGDLMICLHWQRDGEPHKSQEGLALADYLTNFGMVDHELWVRREVPMEAVPANGDTRRN